jgi:hypothetical protein
MNKNQKPKPKKKTGDDSSAEEKLKQIIEKKEAEKGALKKIMDSLEKKQKPKT